MAADHTRSRISGDAASEWVVEVLYSPDAGAVGRRELVDAGLGIDRQDRSTQGSVARTLVVDDPSISRNRIDLRVADAGVRIIDSGSRNPAFADGVLVDGSREVGAGAILRVGNSLLGVDHFSVDIDLLLAGSERASSIRAALQVGPRAMGARLAYDLLLIEEHHRVLIVEASGGDGMSIARWLAESYDAALVPVDDAALAQRPQHPTQSVVYYLDLSQADRALDPVAASWINAAKRTAPPAFVVVSVGHPRRSRPEFTKVAAQTDTRVMVPSLADRRLDVAAAFGVILAGRAASHRAACALIEAAANYPWPEGLAELHQHLERMRRQALFGVAPEQVSLPFFAPDTPVTVATPLTADKFKAAYVRQRGNMTALADELGVSRAQAYRLPEKLGLDLELLRDEIPARPGNRSRRARPS